MQQSAAEKTDNNEKKPTYHTPKILDYGTLKQNTQQQGSLLTSQLSKPSEAI
jgi:hypothetical protein